MPPLAMLLIPLIPQVIDGLLKIIDTIRLHPDTPEATRQQLADISAQLDVVVAQVKAVQV